MGTRITLCDADPDGVLTYLDEGRHHYGAYVTSNVPDEPGVLASYDIRDLMAWCEKVLKRGRELGYQPSKGEVSVEMLPDPPRG